MRATGFSKIAGNLFEEERTLRESAAEETATVTEVVYGCRPKRTLGESLREHGARRLHPFVSYISLEALIGIGVCLVVVKFQHAPTHLVRSSCA